VRRWLGSMIALFVALVPAVARASEGERSLAGAVDLTAVVLMTLLALGVVAVVLSIGYLYRRERGLDWDFQKPDASDDQH
jgi:hypothetical protein